ncbi:flagellar assembly protein FliH [mine drainage metagenome]|uniref:Flagellar assembly protein FliH n=1 Tax=mine drainage metagenome TaxID=410659 RepID=A0A1J5RMZ4_9ZZZZ
MNSEVDKGKLSAWERWEMASLDGPEADPRHQDAPVLAPEMALPTAQEIEQIRLTAHQEGFQRGHQDGYRAGQAQARTEGQQLAALAVELDRALVQFDQQVAEDLLHLALEVARQVVRQSVAARPERVIEVIHEALAQMPLVHAVIRLHPQDASLARSYLGDQFAHAGHRILEDPRQERGGCILESGGSQLDASIATRWRRVAESLGASSDWLEAPRESPP